MRTMFVKAFLEDVGVGETCFVGVDGNHDVRTSVAMPFLKGTTIVAKRYDGLPIIAWKADADEVPSGTYSASSRQEFDRLFPQVTKHVTDLMEYRYFMLIGSGVQCFLVPEFMRQKERKIPKHDGMVCNRCEEPVLQAAPNQGDGSFRCYTCRTNPFR